jgi:PTS system mannose-specific IIB component/fructoselysine and glucoselysine-specific PTS system IIB component
MSIVLCRVDERLIHGQVVVGWGERLHVERIVVVDDQLRESAWEQELYCLGVPPSMQAEFVSVEEARAAFPHWQEDGARVVLLLRDVPTLERLAAGGLLSGQEVNLGGIYSGPGRTRVLPYLFLDEEERAALRRIRESGAHVTARDLPASRTIPLAELIDGR